MLLIDCKKVKILKIKGIEERECLPVALREPGKTVRIFADYGLSRFKLLCSPNTICVEPLVAGDFWSTPFGLLVYCQNPVGKVRAKAKIFSVQKEKESKGR